MAKIRLLIDTDVLIDALRGIKPATELLRQRDLEATAWSKKLPLLMRNRKHFRHIEEITLSPVYNARNGE